MDLRQLEYFAAVARHRHFRRAAESLYVTQSAVSQQVRRLEAELGLELLRRTSRGVQLTEEGAELLGRADAILAEVAGARAAMDDHAGTRARGRDPRAVAAGAPRRAAARDGTAARAAARRHRIAPAATAPPPTPPPTAAATGSRRAGAPAGRCGTRG